MIAWILIPAMMWVGIPLALFVFARRLLRAIERRSASQAELGLIDERLARIEGRIEEMALAQEKLSEGQRFTTSLLSGRPREEQ